MFYVSIAHRIISWLRYYHISGGYNYKYTENIDYLFQTHNARNLDSSRGKRHYVIGTPILHTLAMMAKSALNLTLPSWLPHTQGPPTLTNSHMYLNSLLVS